MAWNLDEAISYYKTQGAPRDQSAVISLLREIQQKNGGSIPQYSLNRITEAYSVNISLLHTLIKRIPSLRVGDTHCLEMCAGPNCGKHIALAEYAQRLQKQSDGKFTLKSVPCMRMCGKGPNIKWDGKLYHQATEALIKRLTER